MRKSFFGHSQRGSFAKPVAQAFSLWSRTALASDAASLGPTQPSQDPLTVTKKSRGAEHPGIVVFFVLFASVRDDRVDREQELVVLLAVVEG